MLEQIRALLADEPSIPATEVHRRSRLWGFACGRSTTASLVKELRPLPKKEPIIRFGGLPAEYAQFDFGVPEVTGLNGTKDKFTL